MTSTAEGVQKKSPPAPTKKKKTFCSEKDGSPPKAALDVSCSHGLSGFAAAAGRAGPGSGGEDWSALWSQRRVEVVGGGGGGG